MALSDYPQPSLTADVALFAVDTDSVGAGKSARLAQTVKVLLIRRGGEPYRDCWALPGGFVDPGESIAEAAARELAEETGIIAGRDGVSPLTQLLTFSEPGRDPRGWVVTALHLATVPARALTDGTLTTRAGDDASDARWFTIHCDTRAKRAKGTVLLAHDGAESGTNSIRLTATVKYLGYGIEPRIIINDGLAFDHAKMLVYAYLALTL